MVVWISPEIATFSYDISELKHPMELMFYSFEVLMSTIELQSISSNGPIVMDIINDLDFAVPNLCIQTTADRDSIHPIRRNFDGRKHRMLDISVTIGPIELILCGSIVLMSASKL